VIDSMSNSLSDSVMDWVSYSKSDSVNEWVYVSVIHWMSRVWFSDSIIDILGDLTSDWVRKLSNLWMSEWLSKCVSSKWFYNWVVDWVIQNFTCFCGQLMPLLLNKIQ
jgi:hypothetical protein